jgi:hypothetical protein
MASGLLNFRFPPPGWLNFGQIATSVGVLSGQAAGSASGAGTLLQGVLLSGQATGAASVEATGQAITFVPLAAITAGSSMALGRLAAVELRYQVFTQTVTRRSAPQVIGALRALGRGIGAAQARLQGVALGPEPRFLWGFAAGVSGAVATWATPRRLAATVGGQAQTFGAARGFVALTGQAAGASQTAAGIDDGDLLEVALMIAGLE